MRQTKEKALSSQIATYLKTQYPTVIFRYDLAADMKLTIGQASRSKELHGKFNKGYPDLFIAQPNRYHHGLFLELKASNASPYKKDGTLKKNTHLETQNTIHKLLEDKGYRALFVVGFKEAVKIIDEYMEQI